jgi:hypothetical protein
MNAKQRDRNQRANSLAHGSSDTPEQTSAGARCTYPARIDFTRRARERELELVGHAGMEASCRSRRAFDVLDAGLSAFVRPHSARERTTNATTARGATAGARAADAAAGASFSSSFH